MSLGSKPTCTILVRRPESKERLRRSRRVTFIRSSCSHGTRRASFSTVSISAYYKHTSEIHVIHSIRVERNSYIKLLNLFSFENSLVWRNKQSSFFFSAAPITASSFWPTCVFMYNMMKDFQSQKSISFIYNKDLVKGYRNKNKFCLDKCEFIARVDWFQVHWQWSSVGQPGRTSAQQWQKLPVINDPIILQDTLKVQL